LKNIAVILSGCGHRDGSEVTEAASTLIAIGENKSKYQCFAPSIEFDSTNHLNKESTGPRNTLIESARIARGKILNITELNESDFDAVVFVGGSGAATHLSDWSTLGSRCKVQPYCQNIIIKFHKAGKPIGAICIAPVLIAKVLGPQEVTLTLGNDPDTIKEVEKTGAIHEICEVTDYISDRFHKVVTTPAYMYGQAEAHEVFKGISGLIKEIVEMA
jgi:enhancing lycopene biosynthesis protein 2